MLVRGICTFGYAVLFSAWLSSPGSGQGDPSAAVRQRVETALANVTALNRPGQDGFATVWDGNKYVQCRRLPDQALRCESAGALMQPSLARVLTPERVARL